MSKNPGDFIRAASLRIREMDAQAAHERLADLLAINVRETEEFVLSHLPGARSTLTAVTPQEMGLKRAHSLAGGTEPWLAEDYELVRISS